MESTLTAVDRELEVDKWQLSAMYRTHIEGYPSPEMLISRLTGSSSRVMLSQKIPTPTHPKMLGELARK